MSIYLPPIASKKAAFLINSTCQALGSAPEKEDTTRKSREGSVYNNSHIYRRQFDKKGRELRHKPHGEKTGYICQNPRFVCEPVCHVSTVNCPAEQWWPQGFDRTPTKQPNYSLDSTARSDFLWPFDKPEVTPTRHGSNSSYKHVASGIVPGLKDSRSHGCLYCEFISYHHQYDSRKDPTQPMRGKLHGSFVWTPVTSQPLEQPNQKENQVQILS
ncbi:uncharacterized protein C2orf73 homolog [Corticium candelabrum]|uniref:uncharacterized protein C2orf73 homolog n=1 Tax=Corticium candelabrum TaxID=121492 RepID=UPI002E26B1E1|nr:uncharacterized protein C2orf73 homolog [Corticium candelabrum]